MSSAQSQTTSKKTENSASSKDKVSKESREEKPKDERRAEERKEKRREIADAEDASDTGSDYTDSEYSELDLTDNPMYQVLSAFFEDEEGHNLCDYLKDLTDAVREQTKMLSKYIKESESKKQRH